jgi:CRP/FNR family transcriptional regulator, cyclic AMP receptor protein
VAPERKLARVLDLDPDLGCNLTEEDHALAHHYVVAEVLELEPGPWQPDDRVRGEPGHLGLLVAEGLLKRGVELANSACAELLGQGDVLRPWQEDLGWPDLNLEADWEILAPTRLAVLDRRFATAACRWPELVDAVMGRAVQRSRALAFSMALSHLTRVDFRLIALFWHLADRWGRVGPDGVIVPLRLTHQTLGQLVGAQRPSVTTALGGLADAGRISRRDDGSWLLHGEAPIELRAAPAAA